MVPTTAAEFVAALQAHAAPTELPLLRKRLQPGEQAFGIRMRDLFDTARRARALPLEEVELLFDDPLYEVRMGAFCVLDFRAKARRVSTGERGQLHDLYLTHHDAITTWDMVDRAAPSVVGGHLLTNPRTVLHDLAQSDDPLRRRTAVTAPLWFVKHGSTGDLLEALTVAGHLAEDPDPLVHLAVGTLLKHLGTRDPDAVRSFVTAFPLPRAVARAATSKLAF